MLTAALGFSLAALLAGRSRSHAALITVPVLVKAYMAPFGAALLKDTREMFTAIGTGLGIIIASVILFGLNEHIAYLEVLLQGKGWGVTVQNWHQATYVPLAIMGPLQPIVKVGLVLTTVVTVVISDERRNSAVLSLCVGVMTVVLAAPTPNALLLNYTVPVGIVLISLEYNDHGLRFVIPVIAMLLIQGHRVSMRLFILTFPHNIHGYVLPVVQPALAGSAVLYFLGIYRLYRG